MEKRTLYPTPTPKELNCPQVRAKFLIKVNPILNQQVFDNFNQLHSTPSGLDSVFQFPPDCIRGYAD